MLSRYFTCVLSFPFVLESGSQRRRLSLSNRRGPQTTETPRNHKWNEPPGRNSTSTTATSVDTPIRPAAPRCNEIQPPPKAAINHKCKEPQERNSTITTATSVHQSVVSFPLMVTSHSTTGRTAARCKEKPPPQPKATTSKTAEVAAAQQWRTGKKPAWLEKQVQVQPIGHRGPVGNRRVSAFSYIRQRLNEGGLPAFPSPPFLPPS